MSDGFVTLDVGPVPDTNWCFRPLEIVSLVTLWVGHVWGVWTIQRPVLYSQIGSEFDRVSLPLLQTCGIFGIKVLTALDLFFWLIFL